MRCEIVKFYMPRSVISLIETKKIPGDTLRKVASHVNFSSCCRCCRCWFNASGLGCELILFFILFLRKEYTKHKTSIGLSGI